VFTLVCVDAPTPWKKQTAEIQDNMFTRTNLQNGILCLYKYALSNEIGFFIPYRF